MSTGHDEVIVVSLEELTKAFDAWAAKVWDGCKEPIQIEREDSARAAEAIVAQLRINRGE